MRRLPHVLIGLLLAGSAAACTSDSEPESTPSPQGEDITFESLDIDFPAASGQIELADAPGRPDDVNEDRYGRMVKALINWANASTASSEVRQSENPIQAVADATAEPAIGKRLIDQTGVVVSPNLAAANVFSDDLEVGDPRVTSAWEVATGEDEDGDDTVRLTLQTRAAYEVKSENGPTRVIGVLRLHSLTSGTGKSGDIQVGYGWQEFGASDCALAVDDELVPETEGDSAKDDLSTFVEVAKGEAVEMPELPATDVVDEEYRKRCESGTT